GGEEANGGLPSAGYYADQMLRGKQPDPTADIRASRAELTRIITVSLARGGMESGDREYAAQIVAAYGGISEGEAQERVDEILTRAEQLRQQAIDTAREVADDARKA